ncbi:MAG: VWA domain-containing protein [Bacteroidota bacterium]|nr:VWA domain-containing protein [Bacteroidota bacterium]
MQLHSILLDKVSHSLKAAMLYDYFNHISFANIWVLPALILLPIIIWLHYTTAGKLKSSFTVSTIKNFRQRTVKNFFFAAPFWLRLLALACLIIALARPQIKNVKSRNKGEGIDIVLCLDISGSMLSPDFVPNRLEAAKEVASDFVKSRPVDRFALVIFSGESFTLSPLTTNYDVILQQIKSLKSGMLQDGTLIGEGLAKSVERLSSVGAKSKVVILLTDGKEEAPDTRIIDPLTALQIAKVKGVKVYTVGMAGDGFAPTAARNFTQPSNLDEALLQRIAKETGGAYFRARDKEALQSIYSQIDRLEKSSFERITKTKVDEQFVYLLLAALAFLFLEGLLRYTILRTFP